MTNVTATMLRDARLQGQDAVNRLLAQIPSVETATTEQVSAFIVAMEQPNA